MQMAGDGRGACGLDSQQNGAAPTVEGGLWQTKNSVNMREILNLFFSASQRHARRNSFFSFVRRLGERRLSRCVHKQQLWF